MNGGGSLTSLIRLHVQSWDDTVFDIGALVLADKIASTPARPFSLLWP
jgi:hypothetical protein